MISWNDDYSTGIENIDNEHKTLFKALNAFYDGLRKNADKESLAALIAGLVNYTKTHFASEERFMKQIGFPGIENHKKEHFAFIAKAEEFQKKHLEGKLIVSLEVTNFIKNWITHHIKTQDKQIMVFKNRLNQAN